MKVTYLPHSISDNFTADKFILSAVMNCSSTEFRQDLLLSIPL